MEGWSNAACLGYAIMAAKRSELTEEQIHMLIGIMRSEFDFKTLEEAEVAYNTSPY